MLLSMTLRMDNIRNNFLHLNIVKFLLHFDFSCSTIAVSSRNNVNFEMLVL